MLFNLIYPQKNSLKIDLLSKNYHQSEQLTLLITPVIKLIFRHFWTKVIHRIGLKELFLLFIIRRIPYGSKCPAKHILLCYAKIVSKLFMLFYLAQFVKYAMHSYLRKASTDLSRSVSISSFSQLNNINLFKNLNKYDFQVSSYYMYLTHPLNL